MNKKKINKNKNEKERLRKIEKKTEGETIEYLGTAWSLSLYITSNYVMKNPGCHVMFIVINTFKRSFYRYKLSCFPNSNSTTEVVVATSFNYHIG